MSVSRDKIVMRIGRCPCGCQGSKHPRSVRRRVMFVQSHPSFGDIEDTMSGGVRIVRREIGEIRFGRRVSFLVGRVVFVENGEELVSDWYALSDPRG